MVTHQRTVEGVHMVAKEPPKETKKEVTPERLHVASAHQHLLSKGTTKRSSGKSLSN
jgi:hypothetical protein